MHSRSLRIAIADDEGFMRKYLQTVLPRLGHEVVAVARTGRELIQQCESVHPDLLITDVNMPEMDGLEAATTIYATYPLPIIIISGYHSPDLIERTIDAHVMAYLVKPIKQSDLQPVIALAMRRFEQLETLRDQTARGHDAAEDREIVGQALRVLAKMTGQNEEQALERMLQLAETKHLPLAEIAQMIVTTEEATRPADQSASSTPDNES